MNSKIKNIEQEFQNPSAEYRGAPFWAWNMKLDKERVVKQVQQFVDMGMGGFYMHSRVGLATPYLGPEFLECIKACVEEAKEKGMLPRLYDEDRWPSGFGGGYVTAEDEYRCKYLVITPFKNGTTTYPEPIFDSQAAVLPKGDGEFLTAFYVKIGEKGELKDYQVCDENDCEKEGYKIWYVYMESGVDNPWFNNKSYADTLNEKTADKFLDVTYETYYKSLGKEFGKSIPAIFTDEPQFVRKQTLGSAHSLTAVILPFTGSFEETFQEKYHSSILEHIPELLWELPDNKISVYRYRYHLHVTDKLVDDFIKRVSDWCDKHEIQLTGHLMEEPTLDSQTCAEGEIMRNLSVFGIPGIDMLCDFREYTTAKQVQSVAHQYGKKWVASELYGVTNWDFDFRKHKLQGDWQAALGINHRVHHLTWMSMLGEAKRDYPASIGFQSPWYKKYSLIEDYFSRINVIMTQGKPEVKVAVIHPIESYWVIFGPNEQTKEERAALDKSFADLTEWLLFGLIDFDYISESLLPEIWKENFVGEMEYETIIVPNCKILRKSTLEFLEYMHKNGKKVIFTGQIPVLIDDIEGNAVQKFAENCTYVDFAKDTLLNALEENRIFDIHYEGNKHLKKPWHKKNWDGERTEKYLYQCRKADDKEYLFIANGRKLENPDSTKEDKIKISIQGIWRTTKLNPFDGTTEELTCWHENGKTNFICTLYEQDSLLLELKPTEETVISFLPEEVKQIPLCRKDLFEEKVNIIREEKNVLVLDIAELSVDGQEYMPKEEILHIDEYLRKKFAYPMRTASVPQPWVLKEQKDNDIHEIKLRYEVIADDDIAEVKFSGEDLQQSRIWFDGTELRTDAVGNFVDEDITEIEFPDIKKGRHELIIEMPFDKNTNLESYYILGEFDVKVTGAVGKLQKKRTEYGWGDIVNQGMPFYGGNVVYEFEKYLEKGMYRLEVSKYRAALLEVEIDGKKEAAIICSPYRMSFQVENDGIHKISIRSYGNRINTFGCLHDCDENEIYFYPNSWRTEKEDWSYEYQFHRCGILKAPVLYKY